MIEIRSGYRVINTMIIIINKMKKQSKLTKNTHTHKKKTNKIFLKS